jgi:hypothetical protein
MGKSANLNQLGRRNITLTDRIDLALAKNEIFAEHGKANQLECLRWYRMVNEIQVPDDHNCDHPELPYPTGRANEKIAQELETSHNTVARWKKIKANVIPEIRDKVRRGDVSINEAYKVANMDTATQQAIAAKMDYQQPVRAAQPFRI